MLSGRVFFPNRSARQNRTVLHGVSELFCAAEPNLSARRLRTFLHGGSAKRAPSLHDGPAVPRGRDARKFFEDLDKIVPVRVADELRRLFHGQPLHEQALCVVEADLRQVIAERRPHFAAEQVADIIRADIYVPRERLQIELLRIVRMDIADRVDQMDVGTALAAALVDDVDEVLHDLDRGGAQLLKIDVLQKKTGALFDDLRERGEGRARLDGAPRQEGGKFVQFRLDDLEIAAGIRKDLVQKTVDDLLCAVLVSRLHIGDELFFKFGGILVVTGAALFDLQFTLRAQAFEIQPRNFLPLFEEFFLLPRHIFDEHAQHLRYARHHGAVYLPHGGEQRPVDRLPHRRALRARLTVKIFVLFPQHDGARGDIPDRLPLQRDSRNAHDQPAGRLVNVASVQLLRLLAALHDLFAAGRGAAERRADRIRAADRELFLPRKVEQRDVESAGQRIIFKEFFKLRKIDDLAQAHVFSFHLPIQPSPGKSAPFRIV